MFKKLALIGSLLFVVAALILYPKVLVLLASRKTTKNTISKEFFFDAKLGLEGLAEQLQKEGLVDDSKSVVRLGEYKELNENTLASGKYIIDPNTNYRTLLNGFTKNSLGNGNAEVEVKVTFNNCKDIYQLAGKVSKLLMEDSSQFVASFLDRNLLSRLNLNESTISALFLPNTYHMFYDTKAVDFTKRMEKEYSSFWDKSKLDKLKDIGLKHPAEAATLASIVYSEQSVNSSEWSTIASLYLNRLQKEMKLQSDPTFKFCWGDKLDGVQRLTFEHRDIDCPYNTYLYAGLPPGPICIPPYQVIESVLKPEKSDYLFMCAKPSYSGLHDFASNYAVHKKNATIFQRWIAKQKS